MQGRLGVRATSSLFDCLKPGTLLQVVPPPLEAPRTLTLSNVSFDEPREISFEEVTSRTGAQDYSGRHCLVRRSDLPESFEINPDDTSDSARLELWCGYKLIDLESGFEGSIIAIQSRSYQPLVICADESDKRLVWPFTWDFIKSVDDEQRQIVVVLPRGLDELAW